VADVHVSPQTGKSLVLVRTGWVLTGFVGLFLLVDGGARVAGFAPYVEGMTKFGYSASLATPVGLALLASTILMLIPPNRGTRLHPRHRLSRWRNRDASARAGPVVPVPGSPRRTLLARTLPARLASAGSPALAHVVARFQLTEGVGLKNTDGRGPDDHVGTIKQSARGFRIQLPFRIAKRAEEQHHHPEALQQFVIPSEARGCRNRMSITPYEPLKPTTPQQAAGNRHEPIASVSSVA
jgi:DoxX-like family